VRIGEEWDGHTTAEKYARITSLKKEEIDASVWLSPVTIGCCRDYAHRSWSDQDKKIREALGDNSDSPLSTDILASNMVAERDRLQQKIYDGHYDRAPVSRTTDQLETIRTWTRLSLRMPGFCSVDEWMGLTIEARDVILRETVGHDLANSSDAALHKIATETQTQCDCASCRFRRQARAQQLHLIVNGVCACGTSNCSAIRIHNNRASEED